MSRHGQALAEDVERFTTHAQGQGENSYRASTKSNSDKAREEVVRSQEQAYENALADLREDHEAGMEALREQHEKAIEAAKSSKVFLQRRIKDLILGKSCFKQELEAKETILQDTIATCEDLRKKLDKLKEERDSSLIDHTGMSALQEENAQLLVAISSLQAKETTEDRSAGQVQATSFKLEGQKEIEDRLQEALTAKAILATRLSEAQQEVVYYNKRADELNFALQLSPNEVSNIKGVIELKDKMFSDLEERARECFNNFTELKKSSGADKALADKEIVTLQNKLDKSEKCVATLQDSKTSFQDNCERLYESWQKQDFVELNEATVAYHELVTQENILLKAENQRQAHEISSNDLKILALEAGVRLVEKSLQMKEKMERELEVAMQTKDAEIGRLQWNVEHDVHTYQESITRKDAELANLGERLQNSYNETHHMLELSVGEREREFLESKQNRLCMLEGLCQELFARNQNLERHMESQAIVSGQNAEAACIYEYDANTYRVQLEAMEDQAKAEKERVREELGLPDSVRVPTVVEQKLALDEKRLEIELLEEEVKAAQDEATRCSIAYDRVKFCGEQWVKRMRDVGYELLGRLNNVEGTFEYIESGEPIEMLGQTLDECREAFRTESKSKGKERAL